jgi:hypothetical protein
MFRDFSGLLHKSHTRLSLHNGGTQCIKQTHLVPLWSGNYEQNRCSKRTLLNASQMASLKLINIFFINKMNKKELSNSMKIAVDFLACTSEKCQKEQNNVYNLKLPTYAKTVLSKQNKILLKCQIDKCREKAILQLTNLKDMYKQDATSCKFVDDLLKNPDKIKPTQYIKAVTNFFK